MSAQPLDLGRRRRLGELLSTTWAIYRANPAAVLISTGVVVAVVDLIAALGLHQLTGHYKSHPSSSTTAIQLLVSLLVLTPLINAMLALLLQALSQDTRPGPLQTIQRGLDVFGPALVAVVLWAAAVVAGSLLIFLAVYFFVVWYFATQAVAIEGRRAFGALARSNQLVSGQGFRVLGILLVVIAIGSGPPLLVGIGVDALARSANAEVIVVLGNIVTQTLSLSFVAVVAGLLFFDLRAAKAVGAST